MCIIIRRIKLLLFSCVKIRSWKVLIILKTWKEKIQVLTPRCYHFWYFDIVVKLKFSTLAFPTTFTFLYHVVAQKHLKDEIYSLMRSTIALFSLNFEFDRIKNFQTLVFSFIEADTSIIIIGSRIISQRSLFPPFFFLLFFLKTFLSMSVGRHFESAFIAVVFYMTPRFTQIPSTFSSRFFSMLISATPLPPG